MSPEGSLAMNSITHLLTFFPADGQVLILHPRDASCFLKEPNSRGSSSQERHGVCGDREETTWLLRGRSRRWDLKWGGMFIGFFTGENSLGPAEQEGKQQGRAGGWTCLLSVLQLCPLPYPFGGLVFPFPSYTLLGLGTDPSASHCPSQPGAQNAGLLRSSAWGPVGSMCFSAKHREAWSLPSGNCREPVC